MGDTGDVEWVWVFSQTQDIEGTLVGGTGGGGRRTYALEMTGVGRWREKSEKVAGRESVPIDDTRLGGSESVARGGRGESRRKTGQDVGKLRIEKGPNCGRLGGGTRGRWRRSLFGVAGVQRKWLLKPRQGLRWVTK